MSKINRINKRQHEAASSARIAGFYAVRGIENVISSNNDVQPAYWDGSHWHIIGWASPLADGRDYAVVNSISV